MEQYKLDLIISQQAQILNEQKSIAEIIREKISTAPRQYLNNQDLEQEFYITRSTRNRMIKAGLLRPIKINGSRSTSIYKRSEVEAALEANGYKYPHSNKQTS